ncbi:uncharacterized protein K02A2.6-like [Frankliniella occidentalis]|uniref:RNA-directed DNA polymerase n=1 Tax=Frankliniella occidentalis TaxID=133901 RepID=A0A9C6X722_FRAOC|nr:uncharacterized protein K02A2.6-like [Frankliniella occidentalis]
MALNNKTYFSVLDLTSGFWHCKLDKQSSELCKFSTPFGIYQFLRLPFGLNVSPEIFQKAVYDLFGDIEGVVLYFDDMLIVAKTEEEHDQIFLKVIERAKEHNVRFNPSKIQYKRKSVKFLGHVYSESGKTIDPDRVEAIMLLKSPRNVKELQRLLGIINHVREFIPNLADETSCLTQLIRKNVHYEWLPFHEEALDRIKSKIVNAVSLVTFDPNKPTEIQCDASKDGLGSCLFQDGHPIAFVSRSLTKAEKNYAQIEKELLAIVFSVQKFHYYIYGLKKITVFTDHKPLVPIFKQALSDVTSKRITRLLLKTTPYQLEVIYKPGKEMHVADALSRDFLPCKPDDEVLITQVHSVINKVVYKSNDIYVQHTKEDPTLSQVIKFHYEGWPKNVKWLEGDVKAFFNLRNELSVDDDLLYFRNRLVIPNSLKNQSLQQLHSGHQGIVKCKSLARETIFWPGINKDIESFVSDCLVCSKFSPAQKKLIMISHDIPNLPYQQVATDILDFHGDYYLVVIDTYSKWIDAIRMPNKTSEAVIDILKFLFAVHGIPCVVLADNNPFKSYKCAEFAKELNFKFVSCSPYYHQSNGLAEKAVSIVKQFLRKCANDPRASLENCLLHYRVTPLSGLNASPAQLLMSRQLRTMLPIKTSRLKPSIVPNVVSKLEKKALTSKMHYDKTAVGTEIEFSPSDYVFVKNPLTSVWEPGIVVEVCSEPRSYMVKTNFSSNIVRRNSTFLKPRNVKAPVRTPVYLLPGYNNVEPANVEIPNLEIPVIPEQPHDNVNNEIPNNNVPLQEVNENLRRWRQQLADRFAQPANQNANRTRTRVVKPPERLNL